MRAGGERGAGAAHSFAAVDINLFDNVLQDAVTGGTGGGTESRISIGSSRRVRRSSTDRLEMNGKEEGRKNREREKKKKKKKKQEKKNITKTKLETIEQSRFINQRTMSSVLRSLENSS